ncbi:MAG: hypothetical protein IT383_06410 [Deltaproteobacteria bacterium]|nr:hypothetical protein [Deltaproteobacteria bacterium]
MPSWLYDCGRALGSLVLLGIACALLGAAALPPALGLELAWGRLGLAGVALGVPVAFAAWGVGYCLLVIAVKWLSFSRFKPGSYPFASLTVARWAAISYLALVANELFLRWVIGMPFINWWYQALGARIGRGVTINTFVISDWDMITIDDDVFVGGRATVIGHAGEMNQLRLAPVHIGKKCSIGQEAAIFPGVVMKDGAVVGANAVVPKFTELGEGEIWGGVPARFIKKRGE